jgi:TatD DNase family protein
MLIDTHCHIHETDYPNPEGAYLRALEQGVEKMICVGTSEESSQQALAFAATHPHAFAALGVHPHESSRGFEKLFTMPHDKVIAIGEIGLDYFYNHSPREVQIAALRAQLAFARDHNLPVIFHVREAFADFWPIYDEFQPAGVLHSFTDTQATLDAALQRGLFIGVNGISTFTKDPVQQAMFDTIPLDHMLLETDAPFLTPSPLRGTINEPAFVRKTAEYHAERRGISIEEIAAATTASAQKLFAI